MVAVSNDAPDAAARFAAEERIPFPVLADPSGEIARAYGVEQDELARRSSFLLDEAGRVVDRTTEVRVSRHGEDVLARVRALR